MNRRELKTPTYTKRDIVKKVAELRRSSFDETAEWVNAVFTAIRETLMQTDKELRIEIRDFGVLEVKQTKPKPKARNPHTGETVFVPARRKTHFKPGKILKEFLSRPLNGEMKSNG